jgi:hypothetical protein
MGRQGVEQCRPDVAGHGHGFAGVRHQLTGERGDRGLAVGAGDGQHRRGIATPVTQRLQRLEYKLNSPPTPT